MSWIGAVFLSAVLGRAALSIWLAGRQVEAAGIHRSHAPRGLDGIVSIAECEQTSGYTRARMRLVQLAEIVQAMAVLLLTFGGGIAAVDAFWRQTALTQPWLGAACLLSVFASLRLVALPFSAYRVFAVEARFGFNHTSPRLFLADVGKRILISAGIATPVAVGAIALLEYGGRWWWLGAWVGWLAVVIALTWAWPRYVAPLFNRFTRLADPELRRRVEDVLERCGFAPDGVFVMDGSRRSAHGNASLTGFGRHQRIVLLDTLLERLDTAEIQAVLAHEVGHLRLGHVTERIAASAGLAFAAFAVLGWLTLREDLYVTLGIGGPSAHVVLAWAVAAAPVVMFFLTPLRAAWARRKELEADDFAVLHVGAASLANALVKIHRDNRSDFEPDPIYAAFFATHPPPGQRIARLAAYPGFGSRRACG